MHLLKLAFILISVILFAITTNANATARVWSCKGYSKEFGLFKLNITQTSNGDHQVSLLENEGNQDSFKTFNVRVIQDTRNHHIFTKKGDGDSIKVWVYKNKNYRRDGIDYVMGKMRTNFYYKFRGSLLCK